jgi:quercetin dioxygenase-like cupin family protein
MAKLFPVDRLPHLHSTRDTRDRLDLITDRVPVDAQFVRADRIIYHPGDTAAKHYHTDCHHLFYVLYGNGILHVNDGNHRLSPGTVAVVAPNEVHWFENDTGENFAFVEFWGPAPKETIWITNDV